MRGIGNIIILTTFFLRDIFVTKILSSAYYYAFGHIFALSHNSLVKVSWEDIHVNLVPIKEILYGNSEE